jgi:membrane protease YdiL (CAAX protease family)
VALRDAGWRKLGFIVSAVAFGAVHGNSVVFVPLVAFGLVQAWLYERTGSLLAPIIAHSLFNLAPFVLLAFGVSLEDGV